MSEISDQDLLKRAVTARENAVAKLTGFKVGAALLTKSGKIYTAANIESDIPSNSICADRLALFMALSSGENEFQKIAIVIETKTATPCGSCRQVLFEFCSADLKIISQTIGHAAETRTLGHLLPQAYIKERA